MSHSDIKAAGVRWNKGCWVLKRSAQRESNARNGIGNNAKAGVGRLKEDYNDLCLVGERKDPRDKSIDEFICKEPLCSRPLTSHQSLGDVKYPLYKVSPSHSKIPIQNLDRSSSMAVRLLRCSNFCPSISAQGGLYY